MTVFLSPTYQTCSGNHQAILDPTLSRAALTVEEEKHPAIVTRWSVQKVSLLDWQTGSHPAKTSSGMIVFRCFYFRIHHRFSCTRQFEIKTTIICCFIYINYKPADPLERPVIMSQKSCWVLHQVKMDKCAGLYILT